MNELTNPTLLNTMYSDFIEYKAEYWLGSKQSQYETVWRSWLDS